MAEKFIFEPWDISKLQSSYDVVIVGSGSTGLTAAIQAHESGLKPVVLEKMEKFGGNTNRASSGMNAAETNIQLHHGIVDNMDDFYKETYKGGGKLNDPELLKYFTSHSALAIDWLKDHGIELDELTFTGGMSKMRTHRPSSMAPIGAFLIKNLLKIAQDENLPVFNNVTVTKVNKENGRVNGVTVKTSEGEKVINAKTVLLATGGFGAAQDIIKKYRPDLASYKTTNDPGATGDGIKLAEELGAQVVQMNLIQVHPTVQQDTPHAFLIGEAVRGEGGILVNGEGQRFVNELNTRKVVSNAITALPEHSAYLIFDKDIRSRVKAIEFYDSIGLVEHGSDLKELAEKINVPADKLETTVNNWNQMVAAGKDTDFDRKTGMERKISEAPYYAIHIAPAIHYTMGGIHIDSRTRVIDGNGDIIPGLLAAGEVAGGLHGNNRIGGNSIAETVIFGIQAGREAFLEK